MTARCLGATIGAALPEAEEGTRSYPYMSANQWWGLRDRLKKSVPGAVTLDWIMGALDTSQKSAQNVLPQLRVLGLIDAANKPTDLVYDFKDDSTYAAAAEAILKTAYPDALLESYDDPNADPTRVASWFSRNAKTGEQASLRQARLYLLILSKSSTDPEDGKAKAPKAPRKPAATPSVPRTPAVAAAPTEAPIVHPKQPPTVNSNPGGPTLHVDLQIHISADAGDSQIEAIFKSMATHLYGK